MTHPASDSVRKADESARPRHISMPTPFSSLSVSSQSHPSSSPGSDLTPESPFLQFFTAPSSPYIERDDPAPKWHSDQQGVAAPDSPPSPPPMIPTLFASNSPDVSPPSGGYFPSPEDLGLEHDSLTPTEKIYLFSRSGNTFNRVFIIHAMPALLDQISPQDVVEYVLPVLRALAVDEEEQVQEALAQELVRIMWWCFLHCQILSKTSQSPMVATSSPPHIYADTFTPILGTLLLNANPSVGGNARLSVVTVLSRIFAMDGFRPSSDDANDQFPDVDPSDASLFTPQEREVVREELVQHVVVDIGRLISSSEADPSASSKAWLMPEHSCPRGSSLSPSPNMKPLNLAPEASTSTITHGKLESAGNQSPPSSSATLHETTNSMIQSFPDPANDAQLSSSEGDVPQEYDIQQVSVGRLSSMSLMAALAASGSLSERIQQTFVDEVVRVSQDPVYWVRKEASFALGALVKVVPERTVKKQLLPIFDELIKDPEADVRHSTLFALPGLLSRVGPAERSSLALRIVDPTVSDSSPDVRLGLLEALGEIIYSFHLDPGGPPSKLIDLFLGEKQEMQLATSEQDLVNNLRLTLNSVLGGQQSGGHPPSEPPAKSFLRDPRRPFICAFNFPAVASTLQRSRWPQIREMYLHISTSAEVLVQRTLAASLAALAKIIGPDYSQKDLLPIWQRAIHASDEEVKSKAVESMTGLTDVLEEPSKTIVTQVLLEHWKAGSFTDWRTREKCALSLGSFASALKGSNASALAELTLLSLNDKVFAVRQGAISCLPTIRNEMASHFSLVQDYIFSLLSSSSFRHRITHISCQESLSSGQEVPSFVQQEQYWMDLRPLATDAVPGVRIALARFAGRIHHELEHHRHSIPQPLLDIIRVLNVDSCSMVKLYVDPRIDHTGKGEDIAAVATFSRPP